jgi:hypothetical protein
VWRGAGRPSTATTRKRAFRFTATLRDVDVLVFDIQDIGVHFYTYISTMGLAMQATAAQGIPFLVPDRTNPLRGHYVSGFVLKSRCTSFVGQVGNARRDTDVAFETRSRDGNGSRCPPRPLSRQRAGIRSGCRGRQPALEGALG